MTDNYPLIRRLQLLATCGSIAANALCAGGIFTFPLLSPALAAHLHLTQPQLTTIVLAGTVGQYPFAAFVGKAIDHYGPWSCSLASSFLFSLGFGLFSCEISKVPDDVAGPRSAFVRLSIFYLLAGVGTVTSYFSSLFAASKNFPEYIGVAAGTSMALFGLSPLFLSVLASAFFSDEQGILDVTHFVAFMAVLAGTVHAIGAITLRTPPAYRPRSAKPIREQTDEERAATVDERTPLNAKAKPHTSSADRQSVMDLFKDPYFLLLAVVALITLGSCEMVITNIGSIALSLPSSVTSTATSAFSAPISSTAVQVRIFSVSNTLSRLLVGPLADFISPVASYLPCGTLFYPRKHHISRVAFLTGSSTLLALTYAWMLVGIREQQSLWALSIGTGIAYGSVFTVLPSIVSSIWGMENLGRNFGVITYSPFIGTPLFSYLYAFISASHIAETEGNFVGGVAEQIVCKGVQCWQLTFAITAIATVLSLFSSVILWRRWKGRL